MCLHRLRLILQAVSVLALMSGCWLSMAIAQPANVMRLGVLEQSPPMSWKDANGEFHGYTIDMAKAMCERLTWKCELVPSSIGQFVEDLQSDRIDIAAMSLSATKERQEKVLFARPFYTSITVFYGPTKMKPDQPDVTVAVVKGSVQARYAQSKGWKVREVVTNAELATAVSSGQAHGMLAPMMTVISASRDPTLAAMNFSAQHIPDPELTGATSFAIGRHRPEVKTAVDKALEFLEINGVYDQINSKYVPFSVN